MPATTAPATHSLLCHWRALIIRGVLAIVFGVLAVILPHITIVALIAVFAAFVLLDGFTSLGSAIANRDWGWQLFGGLLSIAIGVLTIMWPASAGFALIIFIAAWALVRGIFDIAAAVTLRHELASRMEWLLVVSGIVSILFGLAVAAWPALGAIAIVGMIAGFAIFLGILLVAAGLRGRQLHRYHAQPPGVGPPAGQAV
jgi:uncharacterized membrane protein HdeD (DUF308 family)